MAKSKNPNDSTGSPPAKPSFGDRAAMYRAIVERANCGIMLVRRDDGRFTEVNPKWCEMMGYSASELLGMTIFDVSPREDLEACLSVLDKASSSAAGWNGEKRYLKKDGSFLYGEVHASLVQDEKGDCSHLLGIIQDISARKRAEEELARRTLYVRILNSVALAINDSNSTREALSMCLETICSELDWKLGHALVVDPKSGVVSSFGIWHGAEERFSEFVRTSEALSFARGIGLPGRVSSTGNAAWIEDVTTDLNFPRREVARRASLHGAAAFPVTIESEVVAILEFFSNSPMALDASLLELMSRVGTQLGRSFERDRSASRIRLGEEQLRQSQKMEALGRLAGGVAHDFNNMLTAINGYAELLLKSVGPEDDLRPGLTEILGAGQRAANLAQQLLAFSRSQLLELEVIEVDDVILRFESMLAHLVGENIQLVTALRSDRGLVKVSPGQIEQVVMNFAVNARDAMPEGGTLLVETSRENLESSRIVGRVEVPPGSYVRISVTDSGCGMSEEVIGRVFEPFFTTKEHGRGTGLGLSTVYGIVKQSGGHIAITSEPGKGSCFEIYLPSVSEPGASVEKAAAIAPNVRGRETVLVVEDDDAVRTLVVTVLEKNGYEVVASANALEAFTLFDAKDPGVDLLLTDVMMPYMSGPELGRRLSERAPDMKVLFMSGWTGEESVRATDWSSSVLAKPFGPETLLSKIREVLDDPATITVRSLGRTG